jgi:hypothetical protein
VHEVGLVAAALPRAEAATVRACADRIQKTRFENIGGEILDTTKDA